MGVAYIEVGDVKVELPEPNGKSFIDRAREVYDSDLDPAQKEEEMFKIFMADFMNKPFNQYLKAKAETDEERTELDERAKEYAVRMINHFNGGDL